MESDKFNCDHYKDYLELLLKISQTIGADKELIGDIETYLKPFRPEQTETGDGRIAMGESEPGNDPTRMEMSQWKSLQINENHKQINRQSEMSYNVSKNVTQISLAMIFYDKSIYKVSKKSLENQRYLKIRTESKKLIGLSLDPENEVFCSD